MTTAAASMTWSINPVNTTIAIAIVITMEAVEAIEAAVLPPEVLLLPYQDDQHHHTHIIIKTYLSTIPPC